MDKGAVHAFGVLDAVVAGFLGGKTDEASLSPHLLYGFYNKRTVFCHNANNNALSQLCPLNFILVSKLASDRSVPPEKGRGVITVERETQNKNMSDKESVVGTRLPPGGLHAVY